MPDIQINDEAVRNIIARFNKKWQKQADKAVSRLYEELKSGKKLIEAEAMIEKEFPGLFRLDGIHDAMAEAAAYGYGIMPEILTDTQKAALITELSKPWSGDNMPLSARLHGASLEMRNAIITTVSTQIRQNKHWQDIARALYNGYGKGQVLREQDIAGYMQAARRAARSVPADFYLAETRKAVRNINRLAQNGAPTGALKAAYAELYEIAKKGSDKAIEKALYAAIQEKSRYAAQRIARTESARAWADGFYARYLNDPDVIGVKWRLGSRHPRFDVCDLYAGADLFNLGAGVYPKDKAPPYPAHPHCLCRLSEVYRTEFDPADEKDNIKDGGAKWLHNLTDEQRRELMGIEGAKAFADGGDWREYLRNWQGLENPKSRLTPAMFDLRLRSRDDIIKLIQSGALPLEILEGRQNKHIPGTNEYKQYVENLTGKGQYGPSVLTVSIEEAQALVNKYSGTVGIRQKGNAIYEEITQEQKIGVVINNITGAQAPTGNFKIHYATRGTHIVPDYPDKGR